MRPSSPRSRRGVTRVEGNEFGVTLSTMRFCEFVTWRDAIDTIPVSMLPWPERRELHGAGVHTSVLISQVHGGRVLNTSTDVAHGRALFRATAAGTGRNTGLGC